MTIRFIFAHRFHAFLLLGALWLPSCSDDEALRKKYAAAVEAYKNNEIATAVVQLRELYNRNPDFEKTRLYYGRALFYSREYSEAAKVFAEDYDETPESTDALFWHAKTLAQNEATRGEAMELLETLVANNSGHIGAWQLKGSLHEERQEIAAAFVAYRAATAEEKKLAIIHLRLGVLYKSANLPVRARNEFQRARLLAQTDSTILALLAEAERKPAPLADPPAVGP